MTGSCGVWRFPKSCSFLFLPVWSLSRTASCQLVGPERSLWAARTPSEDDMPEVAGLTELISSSGPVCWVLWVTINLNMHPLPMGRRGRNSRDFLLSHIQCLSVAHGHDCSSVTKLGAGLLCSGAGSAFTVCWAFHVGQPRPCALYLPEVVLACV